MNIIKRVGKLFRTAKRKIADESDRLRTEGANKERVLIVAYLKRSNGGHFVADLQALRHHAD